MGVFDGLVDDGGVPVVSCAEMVIGASEISGSIVAAGLELFCTMGVAPGWQALVMVVIPSINVARKNFRLVIICVLLWCL